MRVVDALRVLSPFIVPLSFEAMRQCHDAYSAVLFTRHVEHTGFRLLSADASPHAEVVYVGDHPTRVAQLDDETVLGWLRSLEGPCPVETEHRVSWDELRVTSSRVRVPRRTAVAGQLAVRAAERPGLVHTLRTEDIAGAPWVTTPTEATRSAIMRPPLSLSFTHECGDVAIQLAMNWSWWKDASGDLDDRMKSAGFESY